MEERVLVWAHGRDGSLTCTFLEEAGFESHACAGWDELNAETEAGVGMIVVAGELLSPDIIANMEHLLRLQPPWSDLPLVIVAGADATGFCNPFDGLGSVSILHRPISLDTLGSTVRTALQARRRQYQVRDLLRQREESERRKDEFLAMLAHELRNPLAPIRTGMQVLRLSPAADVVDKIHDMIDRQVGNLTRLVDDLLDVSRITRGKITLQKRLLDVQEVLSHTADGIAGQTAEKGINLEVIPPDGPLFVEADPTRLDQMIGNVLGNALKFTPAAGTIRLSAAQEQGQAVIRVRDTGLGIPPSQLSQVFELFAQTERQLDRSLGGLGIGLTVVRSLAHLHGGSVEVFSEGEGMGTEVLICLPHRPPSRSLCNSAERAQEQQRCHTSRVLIIEDNRDAADALALYLQAAGQEVATAADGPTGVAAALRSRPDVIICDIGLPGMDGYEVARTLRSEPGFRDCLFLAVTGYGDVADRERTRDAGFDHHLTKPADPGEVARLITQKTSEISDVCH